MSGGELVFHLAANADVRFGPEHPEGPGAEHGRDRNVLEAMRANGVEAHRFLLHRLGLWRAAVIPTPEDAPFPVQTSLYGASKLAAEGLIAAYARASDSGIHFSLRLDSGRALLARSRLRFLPPIA